MHAPQVIQARVGVGVGIIQVAMQQDKGQAAGSVAVRPGFGLLGPRVTSPLLMGPPRSRGLWQMLAPPRRSVRLVPSVMSAMRTLLLRKNNPILVGSAVSDTSLPQLPA